MKTVEDLNVKGKKLLIGVDYNVPLDGGQVSDDERITSTFPLLNECLGNGATQIILMSHLGRPQKELKKRLDKLGPEASDKQKRGVVEQILKEYDMGPVQQRLQYLLSDQDAMKAFSNLKSSTVVKLDECVNLQIPKGPKLVLLNNLRLQPGEEKNDDVFADGFVNYGDVMIQEAFGRCHRAHASTDAIVKAYLKKGKPVVAGPLVVKEVKELEKILAAPKEGFVAVLGGAKVSDKIGVIDSLLDHVDTLVIGGAMAYIFLKYREGVEVGKSLVEDEIKVGKDKKPAKEVIESIYAKAAEKGVEIYLPLDHIVAENIKTGARYQTTEGKDISPNLMGVDIGPKTRGRYSQVIAKAKTILWNGPMGVFEVDKYDGTKDIANAVAESNASRRVIGGADTITAVKKYGLLEKLKQMANVHISTGGGASLEFIEKAGKIPGLLAIGYEGAKE